MSPKGIIKVLPSLPVLTFSLKANDISASINLEQNDIYKTVQLMNGLKSAPVNPVESEATRTVSSAQDAEKTRLIEEMKGKLKVKEVSLKEAVEEQDSPITNWIKNRKVYKLFFD